jgi:hypothetical protein
MHRVRTLVWVATMTLLLALISGADAARGATGGHPLSTCFWEGPISTNRLATNGFDGRNFNFPEEAATYWLARFNLPTGSRLTLAGRYPHGRYMSLNAYSEGAPTDALSDVDVRPQPGHVNPFVFGARRDLTKRSWRVRVTGQAPPSDPAARARNTLYAQPGPGASIELVYRVYEPDRGLDLTGGTDLPRPELTLAGGAVKRGAAACAEINDPNRSITVQTIPAATWRAARASPGCDPATNPAYDPPRWERFFNVNYASLAVVSDCTTSGRQARLAMQPELQGGFYSNRDSAYIYSHLSRLFGRVLVLTGRLPRTPQTYKSPKLMPGGQLRFWSLCTGESRVTVRTPDCLSDRQVLASSGRDFTVVVSTRTDRPANATARCGVSWLDWGNRGDGAGDPNYGLVIMRNMLAKPSFTHAIQRVPRPGAERRVMGWFFPKSSYTTRAGFQARGCPAGG